MNIHAGVNFGRMEAHFSFKHLPRVLDKKDVGVGRLGARAIKGVENRKKSLECL